MKRTRLSGTINHYQRTEDGAILVTIDSYATEREVLRVNGEKDSVSIVETQYLEFLEGVEETAWRVYAAFGFNLHDKRATMYVPADLNKDLNALDALMRLRPKAYERMGSDDAEA